LLSRACLVSQNDLPSSDPWTAFPKWNSEKKLDLNLGLPSGVSSAIASAGISFANDRTGSFEVVDLSQQLLAQDELVKLLESADCAKSVNGRDVVVVRGLVTGREILSSGGALTAGAHVKLVKSGEDNFKIEYDDHSNFDLCDQTPVAKFAVVSVLEGAARNG